MFRQFFSWYGPFFKAYSFVLARTQEYEADRRAAQIVGAENKAEALLNLSIHSHFLQRKFWPKIYQPTADLSSPPNDAITQLLNQLAIGPEADDAAQWLAFDLARQTDNQATHPCLTERLAALGYEIAANPQPEPLTVRAAQVFLGDALPDLAVKLDQFWQQEEAQAWKQRRTQKTAADEKSGSVRDQSPTSSPHR